MRTQTNLVRRGAIYYFRARYPADLVPHYGRREILSSLKTKDKQEATSKARTERVRLDQEFIHARALLASGSAVTLPSPVPSEAQIQQAPAMAVPHPSPRKKADDTLRALFNYWKTQGQKSPRSILEAETSVNRLREQVQNKPASEIAKSDIVAFKDKLLAEGKASATVAKQLNLLKAIFQTAADNDKLAFNPASRVKISKQKTVTKSRVPFSPSDLHAIFTSGIYTAGERPRAGAGEAAYWIPLLALWTGARLEELGQLLVVDIQEEAGIKYLHITNEGGDKTVKTTSSRRKVPIHPELIHYGFMRYLENAKIAGHTRLFPLISSAADRQKTASFSKWFGRYLRGTLMIKDSRKVFHSFRHGFKDACRNSGIDSEHHDRLTGHVNGNIGNSYGAEYFPLQPLNKAIVLLKYEGLDLSHLYNENESNRNPNPHWKGALGRHQGAI